MITEKKVKREKINEVKITLLAVSRNESLARAYVSAFAAGLDPTLDELADIRCAVSEAVTNCVVHAYKGWEAPGKIYINARLYSDRTVTVEVSDRGCGIENIEMAMTPLFTTDKEGERSGMGFSVMKSFTDCVKVTSKPSGGTRVFMSKKFS